GVVHLRLDVVGADPLCGNFDTTTVVVKPFAVATAGPDQRKCADPSGITHFTLAGSGPNASTHSWKLLPRAGCAVPITDPSAYGSDVTLAGAGPCLAALELTTSNDCGAATDTVVLSIKPNATADAGGDRRSCADPSGTTAFHLTGSGSGGSPTWSVLGTSGC